MQGEDILANSIDSKTILYQNLLLLGLKPLEFEKEHKIAVTKNVFDTQNAKAVYHVLYFLFQKFANKELLMLFNTCFPPRNLSESIEFKNVCMSLFQILEKEGKIPRGFIVGKSVLDLTHGEKLIRFLRVFSEICLKAVLAHEFPHQAIPFFKLSTPKPHLDRFVDMFDINEFYHVASFQDEKSPALANLDADLVKNAKKSCAALIRLEEEKFLKKAHKISTLLNRWRKGADLITADYYMLKDQTTDLNNRRAAVIKDVPKKFLSDMRALDRIPQTDLCIEVNRRLEELSVQLKGEKYEIMLDEFNSRDYSKTLSNTLEASALSNRGLGDKERFIHLEELLVVWHEYLTNLQITVNNRERNPQQLDRFSQNLDKTIDKRRSNLNKLKALKASLLHEDIHVC